MAGKTDTFLEYRSLLFSIAYNMLGSVDAAEDLVQDTYIKWVDSQETDVRSIKSYLVKTITHLCINYINSARLRRESYVGIWLPEPLQQYDARRSSAGIESWHALSIGQANGKKFTAVLNPIHGREHVGRLLQAVVLKMRRFVPAFTQRVIIANGLPSILTSSGEQAISLISIEPEGDLIRNIYLQTNPDKLHSFRSI